MSERTRYASVLETLRMTSVRYGGVFVASRALNGALALLQVLLVTEAVGPTGAGRFFLLWTAAWLLSVVVKFGADGILPRAVAEARLAGSDRVSMRRVALIGMAAAALLAPAVMLLLEIPFAPVEIALLAGLAVVWAAYGMLAALLKAHGRADLSGVVANVLWPLGPALAPIVVIAAGGDWLTIAELTLLASVLSLAGAIAVALRGVDRSVVAGLVEDRGWVVPVARDEVGAAVLTTLYEVVVWLPVLLGGLLGLAPEDAAGLFVATRIAGLFSWGYQAVTTVLAPQIATAFANNDAPAARRLLKAGALAGIAVSWPLCLLGALIAAPLLEIFDASYDSWASVLVLLIVARAIDAATGPVGEALMVGRRTWVDVRFVTAGVLLAAVGAEALYPSAGDLAIGIGAAAGFVTINLLRLGYVFTILRGANWQQAVLPLAAVTLAAGAALSVMAVAWTPAGAGGVSVAICASLLTAAGLIALGSALFGWRSALTSPLTVVAVVVLCVFALRPAALVADPRSATPGLVGLEFGWQDLTGTIGLATLGFGLFGVAFVLGWRWTGAVRGHGQPLPPDRRMVRGAALALGLGTVLWGTLFLRNGGFRALIEDPASLHLEQFSGGYGVVGHMLCLATALLVLCAWLRRPSRPLAWTLAAAALVSLAASFALQTRGPLVASLVAALVIVFSQRRLSRQKLAALFCVGLVLVLGFTYMRTVREYAQTEPLADAVSASVRTNPVNVLGGDFTEVENFVALRRLVPDGLPWLAGSSLRDVPAAFVPRALWGEKPLPLDFRLSRALYGEQTAAGTPFTLAGELFWNFGVIGVVVGMALAGAMAGLGWRALGTRNGITAGVASAAIVGYSYLLFTRPLGAMLLTLAMALAGIGLAAVCTGLLKVQGLMRTRALTDS